MKKALKHDLACLSTGHYGLRTCLKSHHELTHFASNGTRLFDGVEIGLRCAIL